MAGALRQLRAEPCGQATTAHQGRAVQAHGHCHPPGKTALDQARHQYLNQGNAQTGQQRREQEQQAMIDHAACRTGQQDAQQAAGNAPALAQARFDLSAEQRHQAHAHHWQGSQQARHLESQTYACTDVIEQRADGRQARPQIERQTDHHQQPGQAAPSGFVFIHAAPASADTTRAWRCVAAARCAGSVLPEAGSVAGTTRPWTGQRVLRRR